MNKHIELVKKWLADKDSVSQEELEANSKAAADVSDYAANAAYAADVADYAAAYAANAADVAARYVTRYEELTK